jgi:integrase
MKKTAYRAALEDKPITMLDLLRKAAPVIWPNSKHQRASWVNIEEACEIMGKPLLNEITTVKLDEYTKILSANVAPSTVNRKLSSLHKLLSYAHARDWIEKMPKFTWNQETAERIRWLTPEEEKTLLATLRPDVSAFCEILIHTGMRRGELLGLQPDHIDGDYARLWKTKTKRARSVPLSPRAKELCKQWLPFTLDVHEIQYEWSKARAAMGLADDPHFVLHMLRHTTATRMLKSTNNIVVVQKMLGHSKIATTLKYAHLSDESLLDAVRLTYGQP